MTGVVVAIDGPAGSGKSSVSRAVASVLGYDYQDSGAAYRALAWSALERGIPTEDADAVAASLTGFRYGISLDPDRPGVWVGDTEVTTAIREPRITAVVSNIARVPEVRRALIAIFRKTIAGSQRPGIITEGRDITTVVSPDADVRILLTATEEARMARRSAEVTGQSASDVGRQLSSRDAQDSKVVDFMNAADGVDTIDSTHLDFDQTVSAVVRLIQSR
jgi:cytidylate kinase